MRVIRHVGGDYWLELDHPWQGEVKLQHRCVCGHLHHVLVWSTLGGVFVTQYGTPYCRQLDPTLVMIEVLLCA